MINKLKPYSTYKDAGISSLGRMPAHWRILRLKSWVCLNARVLPETTAPDWEFRYIDIGSVVSGALVKSPQRLRFATAPSRARRHLQPGDTIFSTVRTYLKASWILEENTPDLVCSTGFAVLTPRTDTVPKFVSYLAQSSFFTDLLTADSVGIAYPAIAESRVASIKIPIPSYSEQVAISRFLDHADRRIQRYIRAKKKLIALLTEQKQAIIHRAVTRGLDPNVWLKPSGVDWLGEVPEHWNILPLRRVTISRCDGPFGSGLKSGHYTE